MAESKSAALPLGYAPPMNTATPETLSFHVFRGSFEERETDNVHRQVAQAIWNHRRCGWNKKSGIVVRAFSL
jgi:hypothetical protein